MDSVPEIMLCQPDSFKGCSLCCGLFNFRDCSRDNLAAFLDGGTSRVLNFAVYDEYRLKDEVRDAFTHICPYQGFIAEGKPGCHIHPISSGSEGRERSLFAAKICSSFLCPAHRILSAGEKESLVRHVSDWYLYSIAIADPESFSYINSFIMETYSTDPEDKTAGLLITAGLAAHAASLAESGKVIFYYSQPEYILHREEFCIRFNGEFRERVLAGVRECARSMGLTA